MLGKIKPDDANTEKQLLDLFFLSSAKSTCNVLSKNRGHNKLVPRLHSKHTNITSKVQAIKLDALGLGTES
jgi:hypothetical protein